MEEEDDEEELNDVVEVGAEAVLPSRPSKDGFARLDGHLRKNDRLARIFVICPSFCNLVHVLNSLGSSITL